MPLELYSQIMKEETEEFNEIHASFAIKVNLYIIVITELWTTWNYSNLQWQQECVHFL